MHAQSKTAAAAANLKAYFDTGSYAHAPSIAMPPAQTLVLEPLPNNPAWLRPETQPAPDPDEPRYWITSAGRDYLARERAMEALFGPWPTVASVTGLRPAS